MNKYRARKTRIGGVTYDSALEARYSLVLAERLRRREIKRIQRQVKFNLYGRNGAIVGTWKPDFLVTLLDGSLEVHEAKGKPSRDWPVRRNLFLDNYPDIPLILNGVRISMKGAGTPSRRKRA